MSGQINELATLFADDFNTPLNPANWDYNHWQSGASNTSFNGRTQYRQSLPGVSNGELHLELDTYNPTNGPVPSFYGSEVITHNLYSPGVSFEIKAHFENPLAAGIVGGMFGYSNFIGLNHDEIDFEALSNTPNQIHTNDYANEPLGVGHPQFTTISSAITVEHTYRIEWFPNAIRWFVDGQLVREQTDHIPQHPMALRLDIYAPAAEWADAFSGELKPVTIASANTAYFFDIDSVRIAQLPQILTGTSGNDIFNGDAGVKTVLFSGNEANFTISQFGSGFAIKDNVGTGGSDTVINIDTLLFNDHTLTIAATPTVNLLESYRIYKAAFDRVPDYGGLGYWFKVMDHGASLTDIAGGFIGSNEFKAMYGDNPSDSTFVSLLYHHVLGRDLDPGGYDFWMNDLKVESRAQVLAHFSESAENIANVAGVIANGIIYEVYAS